MLFRNELVFGQKSELKRRLVDGKGEPQGGPCDRGQDLQPLLIVLEKRRRLVNDEDLGVEEDLLVRGLLHALADEAQHGHGAGAAREPHDDGLVRSHDLVLAQIRPTKGVMLFRKKTKDRCFCFCYLNL